MSVPLLGAFSAGVQASGLSLVGLLLIGLCAHCFGFSLNDLIDLPFDRQAPYRQDGALIAARVSRKAGWVFALLQVPLAIGVYIFLDGQALGVGALCISISLSIVYNLWSKMGRLPRLLPELALAASILLLCFVGASLRPGLPDWVSLLFAAELGLILLLLNSVSSGLKDLKTDEVTGAHSFVLSTGSYMLGEDQMQLSTTLRVYSLILQLGIWLGGLCLVKLILPGWPIFLLVIVLSIFGALHLRMLLFMNSFSALRKSMPLLNGFYNYTALALLVSGSMPFWLDLVYGLFAAWLLLLPLRVSLQVWLKRQV
jgi:4-hydroxybenzoate polyprenyltransferase